MYREIENAVRKAGQMMLDVKVSKEDVFAKEGPANFVTAYDIRIQKFLIGEFTRILPQASYYGEEDMEANRHGDIRNGYVFFIDPIDGTSNFMFDYTHSCVSVGLSKDGVMMAGFVYNPYVDRMYRAVRGEGAFLNDEPVKMKDLSLADGIAEFGCARYNDERVDEIFTIVKQLFMRSVCVRNGGSAAIGIARVASGSNISYFEMKLQPYDYAAASVIVTEAGGKICRIDGSDITLDRPCSIIAGTDSAVREIMDMCSEMHIIDN